MIEFQSFGKIPRLNRDCVITEKIDGTNSAIVVSDDGKEIGAQSRNRMITPESDNYGFARWVEDNAAVLIEVFGPGRHFGEWWGSGVNRSYNLPKGEKRFSPFNVHRWGTFPFEKFGLDNVRAVPVLYDGPFNTLAVERAVEALREVGSLASPGFMNPEGVIVFHKAGNYLFKVTLENDHMPKELVKNG
jgi:hypothetical protein